MAKKDTTTVRPQKFLFDVNNFNDDYEEVVEEVIPPPPTFSEAELEAARKDGYERGKKDGLAEAAASREKFIAGILETISKHFATLFNAERERDGRYEAEAVHLTRSIFRKLFPAQNEKHGFEELKAVVTRVLEDTREQTAITLEVHPDYVEAIETHIKGVVSALHGTGICTVTANPALGPGDVRMQWEAGGARRTAAFLAGEIEKELDQVLAGKALLHDNKENSEQGEIP